LAVAIYLSEYASDRARSILKPIMEVLAGIPTVVYGYFALTFMTPLLAHHLRARCGGGLQHRFGRTGHGNPDLAPCQSMSEDALSAVPRSLREAAYSLGATKSKLR
jgi:phosphate transport system permease protein